MKTKSYPIMVGIPLILLALLACNAGYILATPTVVPTATSLPTNTPYPTATPSPSPIPPTATASKTFDKHVVDYLLAEGFKLDPIKPTCDVPCNGYSGNLGIYVIVYSDGSTAFNFPLNNEQAATWMGYALARLYGDDVLVWVTNNLGKTKSSPQEGTVNGYDVYIKFYQNNMTMSIVITPP